MNWKYILIAVILTVLVGGGILTYQYWLVPKEEIKLPEVKVPEEVPTNETTDWKMYRNEKYGYSVKYPPKDWEGLGLFLHQDLGMAFKRSLIEDGNNFECHFTIVHNASDKYINSLISQGWQKSEVEIGGVPTVKARYPESTDLLIPEVVAYYYLEYKNNSFEISHYVARFGAGHQEINYIPDPEVESACKKDFDQMLSTLVIFDPTVLLWDEDYCSPDLSCKAGEGDCDSDADCITDYCGQNVGTKYEQDPLMDVCEVRGGVSISVTSPNGGEEWQRGNAYNITWTWEGTIDSVSILIFPESSLSTIRYITLNISNTGSYSWTIPSDFPLANDYRIRIDFQKYVPYAYTSDKSDNPFSIVERE